MKEIKKIENVYLEDFDIEVRPYLTFAEIQNIVDAVESLKKPDKNGKISDTWSGREVCIDMLVLYYATNIGKEALDKASHDDLLCSGLIDVVKDCIENLYQINEAIDYTESVGRAIMQMAVQFGDVIKPLRDTLEKHGSNAISK